MKIGDIVHVQFNGEIWECHIYDMCLGEVALTCKDNPDIYRVKKWFRLDELIDVTTEIRPFETEE